MQFYSFLKNIEFILKSFDKESKLKSQDTIKETPLIPSVSDNGQLGLFAQAVQSEVNKETFNFVSKLVTDSQNLEEMITEIFIKTVVSL